MKEKTSVLFLCIHNSARSQMAEAYLKHFFGNNFVVNSAGIEGGKLNPVAVKAMMEEGIDISRNETKEVSEFIKSGTSFDYVITVCDAESAERCPVFPGIVKREAWDFADPSSFKGSDEEKLAKTREVRDKIRHAVFAFAEKLMQKLNTTEKPAS